MGIFIIIVLVVVTIIIVVKSKKNAELKEWADNKLKNRAERICAELEKNGYTLTYGEIESAGDGHYTLSVRVYQGNTDVGNMRFLTKTMYTASSDGPYYGMHHIKNRHIIGTIEHIIHLDKAGIVIESRVPCSQPPPEWLKICGQVILSEGYTISFPEWMEVTNCPDASKYVNVVFQ